MKQTCLFLLALGLACHAQEPATGLRSGDKGPFIVQQGESKGHARPYVHPLRSPDGKHVLTQFSPGHHKHQTGLYWGQTRINGRDYFHNYKDDYWKPGKSRQEGRTMEFHSELLDAAGEPMLQDKQVWRYTPEKGHYFLDLEWTGTAIQDVTIGKYPYGGLFLRMPWKRGIKAECLNSEGDKNQRGEGKAAKWVDLAMQIEGMNELAHIAIIDHPGNPGYPTLWRIDGQFGIGPALARRDDLKIPKGDSLTYRYRLVVYEGNEFNRELIDLAGKRFGEE